MKFSAPTAFARHAALALLLAAMLHPSRATAQQGHPVTSTRQLSLDEALGLAEPSSITVRQAQNGVTRAKGQYYQARASVSPQLNFTANYQRLIQNQFEAVTRRFAPAPNPNAPPDTAPVSPIALLFGAANTVTLGLQVSQPIFLDNRFSLAKKVARANENVAQLGLRTARAQLRYQIASAYFDAVIAERFVQIAESTVVQTARTFRQTALQRQVGTVAEYDLLRSRVARDAQQPLLIQAQQNRDIATLQLKQLLALPATDSIIFTTPIQDADMQRALSVSGLGNDARPSAGSGLAADAASVSVIPRLQPRDTAVDSRTAIQQARASLDVQRGALKNASLQRLPALTLSSAYQRTTYPGVLPFVAPNFFPQWTAAVGLSLPLWTSGRITGDELVARANVADAEATLDQGRRTAQLDVQLALRSLEQAQANWLYNAGTEEQAERALRIAEVRYTNGISTQLELSDIRNLLIQSQVNRLTAAKDLQLARLRITLLRDLPLGSGGGSAGAGASGGAQTQQQPQQTVTTAQSGSQQGATGTSGRPE